MFCDPRVHRVCDEQTSGIAKFVILWQLKDGTWSILMDGTEIAKGTSTIDPTKKPKTINFTPDMGLEQGQEYLGIYEIEAKKRRLCFAKPGMNRPTEFASAPGSDHFLVMDVD